MIGRLFQRRNIASIASFIFVSACGAIPAPEVSTATIPKKTITVLDVSRYIDDRWKHLLIKRKSSYRIAYMDGSLVIVATGLGGASGLIRRTDIETADCQFMDWVWRVDELQIKADLSTKAGDDVAAAIFLLFGDPGFLSNPDPVPTLRYVWTTERHKIDDIIDNPYMRGVVKNIVIEAGNARLNQWVNERRNVYADYKKAFGNSPKEPVTAIVIFTDNDQTGEPVTAYFREINFDCR